MFRNCKCYILFTSHILFPWRTLKNQPFCLLCYCSKRLSHSNIFIAFFFVVLLLILLFFSLSYYWLRYAKEYQYLSLKESYNLNENYNLNVSSANNVWKISFEPPSFNYSRHPLSGTFTMSNFLCGPFSILINFSYKSVRYLKLRHLKLSLCRAIFSVPSVIFGPIRPLEH